jgi:hypothetical protein
MKIEQMVNEATNELCEQSPYDHKCPTCNGKVVKVCKCMLGNMTCENGHEWHLHPKTKQVMEGSGHGVKYYFERKNG